MSSATCGVGSTSMFGGLCSGNNRRPSMFTAKYRLREERKKVLKMSMGKVKRIEDPESFLRRSVLINNTIKRLQREVREEKMMRHGGGYSKLACHSFRKSFTSSRLTDMHLPDDDSSSSFRNTNFLNNNNRKRPPSNESHDAHLLSGIYVPPTPCVISALDDDDDQDSSIEISPRKKAKLSMSADGSSLLVTTDDCPLDVDVDVDVVGDVETISDWPTPPSPPPPQTDPPAPHSAMACDALHDSLSAPPLDLDVDVRCGVSGDTDTMDLSAVIGVQGDLNPSGDISLVMNEEEEVDVDCEFLNGENISLTPETVAPSPSDDASSPPIHSPLTFRNQLLLSPPSLDLMEDMSSESSEHCKENTCDFPGGSTSSSPHLPTSIVQKCSQSPPPPSSCSCNINNNNNNPNDSNCCSSKTCETCQTSSSSSSPNPPSANPPPDNKQQQYSSCGHSSIFGELQSVVFHSLIASLET